MKVSKSNQSILVMLKTIDSVPEQLRTPHLRAIFQAHSYMISIRYKKISFVENEWFSLFFWRRSIVFRFLMPSLKVDEES